MNSRSFGSLAADIFFISKSLKKASDPSWREVRLPLKLTKDVDVSFRLSLASALRLPLSVAARREVAAALFRCSTDHAETKGRMSSDMPCLSTANSPPSRYSCAFLSIASLSSERVFQASAMVFPVARIEFTVPTPAIRRSSFSPLIKLASLAIIYIVLVIVLYVRTLLLLLVGVPPFSLSQETVCRFQSSLCGNRVNTSSVFCV